MRHLRFLLSPDPDPLVSPAGGPPPAPAPADPPPEADLPHAGRVVMLAPDGRAAALERELDEERESHAKTAAEKKAREVRVAELEDELHRARQAAQPVPVAVKREKPKRSALRDWMLGEGQFSGEEN